MGKVAAALLLLVPVIGGPHPALARETNGEFHITSEEKAACSGDAERLCSDAYPDEEKLLICMKANRTSLTAQCASVFSAGLKRRGM